MTQQPKTLLERILEWAQQLPKWQSDALRRQFQSGDISATDMDDILALAKLEYKIADPKKRTAVPLDASHIPSASPLQGRVALVSISNVKNVNALKVGETLRVATDGLTVIYGDNGAGKSGYARILKRACRARDRADAVLGDARLAPKNKGTPEAMVSASIGGATADFGWIEGKPAPQALSALSVFDSHCARHYLDGDNEVAYMPYGIDLVEGIGRISKTVKEKLVQEAAAIKIDLLPFADLMGSTKVGAFVASLSEKSDKAVLDELCLLTPQNVTRLGELRRIFEASNPAETAKNHRAKSARFLELATHCEATELALTDAAVEGYKNVYDGLVTAQNTAELASKALTGDGSLLPGTGGSAWGVLYAAAQKFAKEAYPTHTDELLHNKARCVLCQQTLMDGIDRLLRFDKYVQDEAEKALRLALAAHKTMKADVLAVQIQFSFGQTSEDDVCEFDSELAVVCAGFRDSAKARLTTLKTAANTNQWDAIDKLTSSPFEALKAAAAALVLQAEDLDKTTDEDARKVLMSERDELIAREKLGRVNASIVTVMDLCLTKASLQAAADAINIISISTKVKNLVNETVSQDLEVKLNHEFAELGVGHVQVQLDKRVEIGKVFHKLKLNLPSTAVLTKILSEGEQRAMALASFLAEVSSSAESGLIFDDPMSSLDHKRRGQFARRLVKEAATRQIVVFTHDLMFMALIEDECTKQRVGLAYQTVKRIDETAGVIADELPFEGMGTRDRIKYLRTIAQEGAALEKAGKPMVAHALLKSGYEQLRESWERAVEEVLLGGVVSRFVPDIATQKLRQVVVEEPDYLEVDAGMTRCSQFTHDTPRAAGPVTISAAAFTTDIEALEAFRVRITKRNEQTGAARKILTTAPPAVLP